MKSRLIRIALASIVAIALSAGIAWWQTRNVSTTTMRAVPIGGAFTLTDNTGKTVTDKDYQGKYLLVYFGYSFCPDVCPTELGTMARAIDMLGVQGQKVQPLFITIDPARDTVEQLAGYVPLFHPSLVGLTGSEEQIREVAAAYRVYYARAPRKDGDSGSEELDYLMDHSSFIFLMGPDGGFLGVYPAGVTADRIAQDLGDRIAG